ncbi:hypothetical protein R3P38DRAFT_306835 [Favolaschia claudopus]|uniref:F-box domain-containing protein n=1 Tax=Favolaschia claudopus TaxID=2862362 RepID=A0AAW0CVH6_9AGAR
MPPLFAAELVDLVLSFLLPNPFRLPDGEENSIDRATAVTLGRCGLVCRAWVPHSRRLLFRHVRVILNKAHGFAKFLRKPSRLTFLPYIRALEFDGSIVEHPWMATVLPRLVPHLSATIRHLVYNPPCQIPSTPIPCLHLLGVTHLVVSDSNQPTLADVVSCVSNFPVLSSFFLWVRGGWGNNSLPAETKPPPRSLQSLSLKLSDPRHFLAWIQTERLSISTLKIFINASDSDGGFLDFDATFRFISNLGGSLTSLTLGFDEAWNVDITKLADGFLCSNPELHTLSLQANYEQAVMLLQRMHIPPTLGYLELGAYEDPDDIWTIDGFVEALNSRLGGCLGEHRHKIATVDVVHIVQHSFASASSEPTSIRGRWGGLIKEYEDDDAYSNWR